MARSNCAKQPQESPVSPPFLVPELVFDHFFTITVMEHAHAFERPIR
jgi:hypothetical protein